MSEQANNFKLGLFVIISFALLVTALALLGAGDFFKQETLVETCFNESVQGLDVGSPVKYRGMDIGKVKEITGASRVYGVRSDYVLVIISLFEDVSLGQPGGSVKDKIEHAVAEGLTVQMAFMGLTGAAYLETNYMGETERIPLTIPWEPKHPYIPSKPNKITQMGESLDRIMKKLEDINIQGVLAELQSVIALSAAKLDNANIKEISTQTATLLREIRTTNARLAELFDSTQTKGLMNDARAAVNGAKDIVESSKAPISQALNEFRGAAATANSLAGSLDKTSRLLGDMVWVNTDSIKDVVDNLKITSENLRQMSQDIKRYPARLLFEAPPEKEKTLEK
ncbi:ABC-type transporter, periplasmic substrate-binding protein [Desulforapulum autotrophicum HRM2]|uniref:ABC-type transporter, periplasmic substrate-binding protein n=1 Tax=Desulforapulum autotrophicum (strain ATCC 43914 / DSM 3382 / VKM B-1955 / HRM2) TaxID=177437 RepID=C0QIN1_DESAH|nr:MlaD family protein [Desulforapulum autotrophicum]ACN17975.1 ABC-type transporter, periplasmic substrate-binding protein [Desulforapulum autotrophicum HRM2]